MGDIEGRREDVADAIYEAADFGCRVEAADGWIFEGDVMRRVVYLENAEPTGVSQVASCEIRFEPDSATAIGAHSLHSKGGVMLFDLDQAAIAELIGAPGPVA